MVNLIPKEFNAAAVDYHSCLELGFIPKFFMNYFSEFFLFYFQKIITFVVPKNNRIMETENKQLELVDSVIEGIVEVYEDIDEIVEVLKVWFDDVRFVDEKIDDGCDESEEDDYVMLRSYDITKNGKRYYLRLFYGDNTMLVGSYEVEGD